MTKDEIQDRIYELDNDEEIMDFIEARLTELESNDVEKTVGQNYTDSFREYISKNIHYKPADRYNNIECPDLVYDDMEPYYNLIKELKKANWYNERTLFSSVFYTIHDYLPSDDIFGFERLFVYFQGNSDQVSIKEIKKGACGLCSERAGLAHNMFKFLGIDSEVICGYRNNISHAYNMIYPNGYGTLPMVIYDPSHHINFSNGNRKLSLGFYKALKPEEYEAFISGVPIELDLGKTESNYRNLYNLEGYEMSYESPTYIYGLNNLEKEKRHK